MKPFGYELSISPKALRTKRATIVHQLPKQMIFGFGEVPAESTARRTILAAAQSDSLQERLDQLDQEFWTDPDELAVRSEAFANTHRLVRTV